MAAAWDSLQRDLLQKSYKWLVTGVAGFIGSHLLETLLKLNQQVVGLDSFVTGSEANLEDVRQKVEPRQWARFELSTGDIGNLDVCQKACSGVHFALHQAALGSVPRSVADPIASNRTNVDGFLNILWAAREQGVSRLVYASSSSVYGDSQVLPKREDRTGAPLSPYAVTKVVNELYAGVFGKTYGQSLIGLRYFNVFGPRQSPNGPYAAVIPRWLDCLSKGEPCIVYGDGLASRDFCYVANVVQANLLAAFAEQAGGRVFNVACGEKISLNQLHELLTSDGSGFKGALPLQYSSSRLGDVRESLADISSAQQVLGYAPTHRVSEGLKLTVAWFLGRS